MCSGHPGAGEEVRGMFRGREYRGLEWVGVGKRIGESSKGYIDRSDFLLALEFGPNKPPTSWSSIRVLLSITIPLTSGSRW